MIDDLIDLYYDILQRDNDDTPSIVFKDYTDELYFNADIVAEFLSFPNMLDDIDKIAKNHYSKLKYLVERHRDLYPNTRGRTIFLDETGLFLMIFSGRGYGATLLKEPIAEKILPSIRRFGEYKIGGNSLNSLDVLNEKINFKLQAIRKMENKILTDSEHKNSESWNKGAIYFLMPDWRNTRFSYDPKNIFFIKFDRLMDTWETRNGTYIIFNNQIYNMYVVKTIFVDNYKNMEECFRSKSKKYGSHNHNDLFECTYDQAIDTIADCLKHLENKEIDKYLDVDIHVYSEKYESMNELSGNKKMKFYIVDNNGGKNMVDTKIQKGGSNDNLAGHNKNYYDKYIKYKQKYLELKEKHNVNG